MFPTHRDAGMPKRAFSDFSGYVPGRTVARRGENTRTVYNSARPLNRFYRRKTSSGVPARYSGRFRRSGYYGRYNRGSQIARLRRGLNIEKKFFDTALNFTFDTTGEVPATGQLTLVPQGVTESTRVGRSMTVKSIQIRAECVYTPAADTVGATGCYLLLVLDKQANGAAAAITDVLTSNDMRTAMINLANSERFYILKRWDFVMQAGAGVQTAFGKDVKQIEYFKKCNYTVEYSSTTGAITEIKSNNIFLLAGCDNQTDDSVSCNGTARLRFTDI